MIQISRLPVLPAMFMLMSMLPGCRETGRPSVTGRPAAPDSVTGIILADTIIYDVMISSHDTLDPWAARSLGRLNRKAMIDSIFSMVYSKRVLAYDHETRERLTLKQVKQIEAAPGFSRDRIGMIQFTEAWYLNPVSSTMTKKVISLVLGYDFYTSDGELFGHKPVFRIEMRQGSGIRD